MCHLEPMIGLFFYMTCERKDAYIALYNMFLNKKQSGNLYCTGFDAGLVSINLAILKQR